MPVDELFVRRDDHWGVFRSDALGRAMINGGEDGQRTLRPCESCRGVGSPHLYLLGYVFRREEFPWVQNYMSYPGDGWLGRGLEFATQPFDVPRREMVDFEPDV